jgi:hypothetical protein
MTINIRISNAVLLFFSVLDEIINFIRTSFTKAYNGEFCNFSYGIYKYIALSLVFNLFVARKERHPMYFYQKL